MPQEHSGNNSGPRSGSRLEHKIGAETSTSQSRVFVASIDPRTEKIPLVNNRSSSLDRLRAFTEQLEDSISKAQSHADPTKSSNHNQKLLQEISEQMPSAIETIRSALLDMTSLSNGMRTLSYLDTRPMRFESLDVEQMVAELLRSNNLFIETNRVQVEVGDLHTVTADQQSLQDILQGLFDNALKYLDPSRPGKIEISAHRDINYTTFCIKDNGRGIRDEDFSKVFDVFKRSDDVVHISGEGMGIPYIQILVRRHLGTLWFNSNYGVGSTFYFTVDNHL